MNGVLAVIFSAILTSYFFQKVSIDFLFNNLITTNDEFKYQKSSDRTLQCGK